MMNLNEVAYIIQYFIFIYHSINVDKTNIEIKNVFE